MRVRAQGPTSEKLLSAACSIFGRIAQLLGSIVCCDKLDRICDCPGDLEPQCAEICGTWSLLGLSRIHSPPAAACTSTTRIATTTTITTHASHKVPQLLTLAPPQRPTDSSVSPLHSSRAGVAAWAQHPATAAAAARAASASSSPTSSCAHTLADSA